MGVWYLQVCLLNVKKAQSSQLVDRHWVNGEVIFSSFMQTDQREHTLTADHLKHFKVIDKACKIQSHAVETSLPTLQTHLQIEISES